VKDCGVCRFQSHAGEGDQEPGMGCGHLVVGRPVERHMGGDGNPAALRLNVERRPDRGHAKRAPGL